MKRSPLVMLLALLVASTARAEPIVLAQAYDGPPSCRVRGLNPKGDGFLAIRTGPGSKYRKIDELYNGDFAHFDRSCREGSWCHARTFERSNGRQLKISGLIHTNWCELYP